MTVDYFLRLGKAFPVHAQRHLLRISDPTQAVSHRSINSPSMSDRLGKVDESAFLECTAIPVGPVHMLYQHAISGGGTLIPLRQECKLQYEGTLK
jgi:hypothetical protein